MGFCKTVLLILVTIFIPPLGVLAVAGCGVDLLVNILLTFLGYLPGHIHAFYLEYIFYQRRGEAKQGLYNPRPAPGIYSERVLRGGKDMHPPTTAPSAIPPGAAPAPAPGPAQMPAPQQPVFPPGQTHGTV